MVRQGRVSYCDRPATQGKVIQTAVSWPPVNTSHPLYLIYTQAHAVMKAPSCTIHGQRLRIMAALTDANLGYRQLPDLTSLTWDDQHRTHTWWKEKRREEREKGKGNKSERRGLQIPTTKVRAVAASMWYEIKSFGGTGLNRRSFKCQSNWACVTHQWANAMGHDSRSFWARYLACPKGTTLRRVTCAEILYECNETPLISCHQRNWQTSKVSLVLNYLSAPWAQCPREQRVEKVRRLTGAISRGHMSKMHLQVLNHEKETHAVRNWTLTYVCMLLSGAVLCRHEGRRKKGVCMCVWACRTFEVVKDNLINSSGLDM